ncbi:peptidase inhibitor family I36 protein [Actinomadura sp. 6N118]|uniref:peptidase inhibitor family I36 protein n=1 Tax=Actinomadura sp. 6N118 TaxID=3375151 RepID=UPI0037BC8FCA
MKRAVGVAMGATMLATGAALVGSAGTAQAAVECGSGMVCIYPQKNYGGTPYVRRASDGNVKLSDKPINDQTYSVINNSSDRTARIYRNSSYGGSHTCIRPGGRIGDLESYPVGHWGSSLKINKDACG